MRLKGVVFPKLRTFFDQPQANPRLFRQRVEGLLLSAKGTTGGRESMEPPSRT